MIKGLYKIFEHWYHGGRIYFYSDPHFADDEMKHLRKNYIGDAEQVKRINSKVGKCDTIIFLGDIGDVEWVKKVRGYKVLIKGNHDAGTSNYERDYTVETVYDNGQVTRHIKKDNHLFDEIYEGVLTISDKIILSHEPIEDLPAYLINVHGHDHAASKRTDRHFNMCAENINYTPVSLNEIMEKEVYRKLDSIHRLTIDKATERKKSREAK